MTPAVDEYVALSCVNEATGVRAFERLLFFDPGNPLGPIAAGERAAEAALALLPLPDPVVHTSPPADAFQLVGFPTWFWTDGATVLSASATISTISATVTATPADLQIDTGDGHGFTCAGARPHTDDCSYTYAWSSRHDPSGRYTATATQSWRVTWTATDGEAGDLGTLTRSASVPLLVQEAQAVTN